MNNTEFNNIVKKQFNHCYELLTSKGIEYDNSTTDRLHSFKAAAILENCSLEQALAGMLAKHTVSIFDMCASNNEFSEELWEEKITDHINYLVLLRAALIENNKNKEELK